MPNYISRFDENTGGLDGLNPFNLVPGQSHTATTADAVLAGSVNDGIPTPMDGRSSA